MFWMLDNKKGTFDWKVYLFVRKLPSFMLLDIEPYFYDMLGLIFMCLLHDFAILILFAIFHVESMLLC